MKNILVIGAGRSSTALINYLLEEARKHQWFVTVADAKPERALAKVGNHPNGRGTWLDVLKPADRRDLMMRADVVISLLPPLLHYRVARDCTQYNKYLVTSSFVNRDLYRLDPQIINAPLFFMGEMGLDPGLEHLIVAKKVAEIRAKGGKIQSLRTYLGDLITPESNDNPWNQKFTWNPRNAVLMGRGISQYVVRKKYKYMSYNRLFKEPIMVNVPGIGEFESFPNRDTLLFRKEYGLDDIPTLTRSTLRYKGFCAGWDALIRLGLTYDTYPILESENMTYRDLLEAYLVGVQDGNTSLKDRIAQALDEDPSSEIMDKLDWLGLFERRKIKLKRATPAKIIEDLLERKWQLAENDKDLAILMLEFKYRLNGKNYKQTTTMSLIGNNSHDTAIAKVIGMPIGICVKLLMEGKIPPKGIKTSVSPSVYHPVLEELKDFGIDFKDKIQVI